MHIVIKQAGSTQLTLAVLSGLLVLSVISFPLQAQTQPKPGPDLKKLKVMVGDWTYEGVEEATPFWPAGKFHGKLTARMVLGGFFMETRAKDTGLGTDYIYEHIGLDGYDPLTKSYFERGFENDGSTSLGSLAISGHTWTTTSTRADSKGRIYRMRVVETFSSDGQTFTESAKYSADGGKTWLPAYRDTMRRVSK